MEYEILRIHSGASDNGLLSDIHLRICVGEIQGLVFDNVLEERYFIEVLLGNQGFEKGQVCFWEKQVLLTNAQDLFKNNVCMPEFYFYRSDELTVADAFFIEQSGLNNIYKNTKQLYQQIKQITRCFSVDWSPDTYLIQMNPRQQVELELIKAFWQDARIIILKDLAARLNDHDFTI